SRDARIGENWDHSQNLIPLVMKAALGHLPVLQIFGDDYPTPDGTCIRDYVHVEDLAAAHRLALEHMRTKPSGSEITLNVGTGTGTSVLEVIAATERITGRRVPYEVVARRVGDPAVTYADPRRIRTILGWAAELDIDDILDSAWRWHAR
ncbi:MAG: NAD-dependent epimerase/dehydratase family protein, partial [Ilumatobacteraceae bacterium]